MKRLLKTLKQSVKLLHQNMSHYVFILMVGETVILYGMRSALYQAFRFILRQENYVSITNDNYLQVLSNPVIIIAMLALFAMFVLFSYIQVSLSVQLLNEIYSGKRISWRSFFGPMRKLARPELFGVGLYFIFIMPHMNIGISTSLLTRLTIPPFIMNVILDNTLYVVIIVLISAVLAYINARLIYVPVIYFGGMKGNFKDAIKESLKKTKKRLLSILVLTGTVVLFSFLVLFSVTIGYALLSAYFIQNSIVVPKNIITLLDAAVITFIVWFTQYSVLLALQVIIVRYHELNEESPHHITRKEKRRFTLRKLNLTIIAGTYGLLVLALNMDIFGSAGVEQIKIVSHRGESVYAIENTIEALELASLQRPDFVEMDIQMTQDGTLVVFHDFTTKRLAGKSYQISKAMWDDLKDLKLTHGSNTSQIATFDAYVARAKELEQPLLVELKSDDFSRVGFIDGVVEVMTKYGMETVSMFQSLDKNTVLEMKARYPDLEVGYIIGINIGGVEKLDLDFYALEETSVTETAISTIRSYEKQLYVWTVNEEDAMQYFYGSDITGIITDDVLLARKMKVDVMSLTPYDRLLYEIMK